MSGSNPFIHPTENGFLVYIPILGKPATDDEIVHRLEELVKEVLALKRAQEKREMI